MSYILDDSTLLTADSEDEWQAKTDQRFWNFDSAFGGWVGALTVAAVNAHPAFRGRLITQNLQFHAAIKMDEIVLQVSLLEQRRRVDFWAVRVLTVDRAQVLASATLVFGEPEASELQYETSPRDVREPDQSFRLPYNETTPTWFKHYEMRLAKGRPFQVNPTPSSTVWIREADGRPLDGKALAAIVDTPMPRSFFLTDQRIPASTVTLSTHVYASDNTLAACGNEFVQLDTDSLVVRDSLINQQSRLYSPNGLLLATSYQTAMFRERR
ncbi:MAG: thioesterase family protein [Pseudomonadota bacterium]